MYKNTHSQETAFKAVKFIGHMGVILTHCVVFFSIYSLLYSYDGGEWEGLQLKRLLLALLYLQKMETDGVKQSQWTVEKW